MFKQLDVGMQESTVFQSLPDHLASQAPSNPRSLWSTHSLAVPSYRETGLPTGPPLSHTRRHNITPSSPSKPLILSPSIRHSNVFHHPQTSRMQNAASPSSPSVPVQLHNPNAPMAKPPHLESPQRRAKSLHQDPDMSQTTDASLCKELLKCGDNSSKKHPKGDGESRVATLRRAIEAKENDSTISALKEQVERLRIVNENWKVSVEVLEGKGKEIKALKEEVERLEKAECDACKKHAEVESRQPTLRVKLQHFHDVAEKPKRYEYGDGATDAEITPQSHQVQQLKKPSHEESKTRAENNKELTTLRAEVDRLCRTETNLKVAVDLLEQTAKELLFLRDEVGTLRQRMATSATSESTYRRDEEELLSLRAEVMRLHQVEENSQVAAHMLEEIMSRSDAAADFLCEMMSRRPEVPPKEINSGVD